MTGVVESISSSKNKLKLKYKDENEIVIKEYSMDKNVKVLLDNKDAKSKDLEKEDLV